MTSEARDQSLLGGKPVKYFRFTRGDVHWYYTAGNTARQFMEQTWLPASIDHAEIQDGGETQQQTLEITLDKGLDVASNWRPYPPADAINVTIWTQHDGEDDAEVDWIGRLLSPDFTDTSLVLQSEATHTIGSRAGAGPVVQRVCDLVVFSEDCGVDLALHQLPATITAIAGTSITAAEFLAFPSGRLAGGWIEWTRPDGIVDRRDVVGHTGDTIQVRLGAPDLAVGSAIAAAPGCSGTWEDCVYFDNTDRCGAEFYMPGRSYYDGNLV